MKKIVRISWMGLVLIAGFALAACGSSGGGAADDQTSVDLTPEEQLAAADMVMTEWNISNGLTAALGGAAAMVLEKAPAEGPLAETISVTCASGGTLSISTSGSNYTATFDNCAGVMETPAGVGITFSITGNVVISGGTVTYDDLTVIWACVVGGSSVHTCHLSGTSTGSGASVTYTLEGYCGPTNFSHTGSMTGTMRAADNHFIIGGSAVYTITGSSSGRIVRCTYADFDVTAAPFADFAAACGLNATVACAPTCSD